MTGKKGGVGNESGLPSARRQATVCWDRDIRCQSPQCQNAIIIKVRKALPPY